MLSGSRRKRRLADSSRKASISRVSRPAARDGGVAVGGSVGVPVGRGVRVVVGVRVGRGEGVIVLVDGAVGETGVIVRVGAGVPVGREVGC